MMQAMSVAPEPSRAGYDRREHRPGLARAHASACASAKQRSQLRCANATCGAGPCGRYGCYGNGDLWVSGGCRMEFRCGRSRGLCGDYRSPQEVYCSCSMFRPSGLDLPPLRELPCSINTNASRAAKALMTPQQSEALMERVGSDKAAYFEQVRSLTGLTTRPRDQFEVEVKGREQRCLSQGRFFVFGDSVARELAERIAQLRGVNTTSQETTACSTTDIFYAFAMRNQATSYLPQQGQLLPHQRLPCKPDWVVYSYGVHHLRAQGSVTYPTCTAEFAGRNASNRVSIIDGYPRCWADFVQRLLKNPGPRYIVSTIMPIEQHIMLARPPKSDGWHFSNAAHANAWLQKQRAFVAALPAEGQPALLDLGRVAADNAGVRCDGMHFAKNWERGIMAKVKCATSAAAYDEALLGALRTHCGCKGAADAAGGARERKRR